MENQYEINFRKLWTAIGEELWYCIPDYFPLREFVRNIRFKIYKAAELGICSYSIRNFNPSPSVQACPACTYSLIISPLRTHYFGTSCAYCPIDWIDAAGRATSCEEDGTLYNLWQECDVPSKRQRYARAISSLPWKNHPLPKNT